MVDRVEPPWAELEHAYGPARQVPDWLRGLGDPSRASRCLDELFGSITHQGTRYSATASAIPFLVDTAVDPANPNRALVLGLVHFAGNGFVGDHLDWQRQRDEQADPDERACWEAVRLEQERLRPLLVDSDPEVAQVALSVLAWSGDRSGPVLERIAAAMTSDDDAVVGAGHLSAVVLGLIPEGAARPTRPVGPGPIAAFGSAIAALRFAGESATDDCVDVLRRTFEAPDHGRDCSCDFLAGDEPSRWAAIALAGVPEHLRARTIDQLTADVARGFVSGVEPLTAVLRLILRDADAPRLASGLSDEAVAQLADVAVALRSSGAQRPWELEDVGLPSTSDELLAWLRQR